MEVNQSKSINYITKPSQGCPAGYGFINKEDKVERKEKQQEDKDTTQDGVNVLADAGGISYGDYLQLNKILTAQVPQSKIHGLCILIF